jgi:hypothetical protein
LQIFVFLFDLYWRRGVHMGRSLLSNSKLPKLIMPKCQYNNVGRYYSRLHANKTCKHSCFNPQWVYYSSFARKISQIKALVLRVHSKLPVLIFPKAQYSTAIRHYECMISTDTYCARRIYSSVFGKIVKNIADMKARNYRPHSFPIQFLPKTPTTYNPIILQYKYYSFCPEMYLFYSMH